MDFYIFIWCFYLLQSLSKAQEASNHERQLIRLQDQAGISDSHNLDITFSVSILFYLLN